MLIYYLHMIGIIGAVWLPDTRVFGVTLHWWSILILVAVLSQLVIFAIVGVLVWFIQWVVDIMLMNTFFQQTRVAISVILWGKHSLHNSIF